jgi:hypothetical protein
MSCMVFFNLVCQPIVIWHGNLPVSKTEEKTVLIGSKLTNTRCWRYFQLCQFCFPLISREVRRDLKDQRVLCLNTKVFSLYCLIKRKSSLLKESMDKTQ